MPSLHAWEFAGSPASFQRHGVHLHPTRSPTSEEGPLLSRERILELFGELDEGLARIEIRPLSWKCLIAARRVVYPMVPFDGARVLGFTTPW